MPHFGQTPGPTCTDLGMHRAEVDHSGRRRRLGRGDCGLCEKRRRVLLELLGAPLAAEVIVDAVMAQRAAAVSGSTVIWQTGSMWVVVLSVIATCALLTRLIRALRESGSRASRRRGRCGRDAERVAHGGKLRHLCSICFSRRPATACAFARSFDRRRRSSSATSSSENPRSCARLMNRTTRTASSGSSR